MVVSENNASNLEVAVTPEVCSTTRSSSTSTAPSSTSTSSGLSSQKTSRPMATRTRHHKQPGGRGNAGGMQHHRILFDISCPIVNIDKLWSLVPEDVKAKGNKDSTPMIDVT
ncbi:hypothetical protein CCACVL1_22424 [Corchorus capsularis]|uniref:Uncharacterized protein n=1 Tax=Corchorus capsularis TaxID=210143 RepID=A0A1R3GZ22_COCAP|nr:hypothetical protein CCACVL1_22424 [Corchorus capsularis]